MSKNACSDSNIYWRPDNPQETLKVENYYYAGFLAAEMSCSVIKATNYNPIGHYYFTVDITVCNADKALLKDINRVMMRGNGIITSVKGAFNLSARGKNRVQVVLDFLDRYPIIVGDLAKNRIALMREASMYLQAHRGLKVHHAKTVEMDRIRMKLQMIKKEGITLKVYQQERVGRDAVGYFLSGVLDGDGSFGFKKSGSHQQPFIAVAMKDQKIVDLFRGFLEYGSVRRRKDGIYHYEINDRQVVKKVCSLFLTRYRLRNARQRGRMQKIQRILNDYTWN